MISLKCRVCHEHKTGVWYNPEEKSPRESVEKCDREDPEEKSPREPVEKCDWEELDLDIMFNPDTNTPAYIRGVGNLDEAIGYTFRVKDQPPLAENRGAIEIFTNTLVKDLYASIFTTVFFCPMCQKLVRSDTTTCCCPLEHDCVYLGHISIFPDRGEQIVSVDLPYDKETLRYSLRNVSPADATKVLRSLPPCDRLGAFERKLPKLYWDLVDQLRPPEDGGIIGWISGVWPVPTKRYRHVLLSLCDVNLNRIVTNTPINDLKLCCCVEEQHHTPHLLISQVGKASGFCHKHQKEAPFACMPVPSQKLGFPPLKLLRSRVYLWGGKSFDEHTPVLESTLPGLKPAESATYFMWSPQSGRYERSKMPRNAQDILAAGNSE